MGRNIYTVCTTSYYGFNLISHTHCVIREWPMLQFFPSHFHFACICNFILHIKRESTMLRAFLFTALAHATLELGFLDYGKRF